MQKAAPTHKEIANAYSVIRRHLEQRDGEDDLSHLSRVRGNGSRRDFSGMKLSNRIITEVTLSNSKFDGANLTYTSFRCCGLEGASFRNALLDRTSFAGSNMNHANICGAKLVRPFFRGVQLYGMRFGDRHFDISQGDYACTFADHGIYVLLFAVTIDGKFGIRARVLDRCLDVEEVADYIGMTCAWDKEKVEKFDKDLRLYAFSRHKKLDFSYNRDEPIEVTSIGDESRFMFSND